LSSGKKLNILISTLLLALFLYLAFRNVNLEELGNILKNTNYFFVFIGMFVGVVLGSVIRAFRWGILLEPVKKNIPFKNLFATTIIGYMVNNLIPRSGEVLRPFLLGKHENISRSAAFATIIVERIIDTVMFLIMFPVALLYFHNRITNAIPEIATAVIILSVLTMLLVGWIIFTIFKTEQALKIFRIFTKILPKKIHDKADSIFVSLVTGFDVLKKPRLLFRIALYSVLLWIAYLVSTFLPFYSFGIFVNDNISMVDILWNTNLLLVLINVAMFVPVPAATGPYHYVVMLALVSIFGVSNSKALGYATATHLMSFLLFLVLGLYFFITSQYKLSEIKERNAKVESV